VLVLQVDAVHRVAAGDAARPDEHVVIDGVALVELDGVLVSLGDRVVREDVDAGGFDSLPERLLKFWSARRENLFERLDQRHFDRGVLFVAELRDFAGALDARQASAADHDLRRIAARRVAGGRRDLFVDVQRVVEALERLGVLFETGDTVVGRLAPHRDQRVVVVDCPPVVEFDLAVVDVEAGDLAFDELRRGGFDLLNRNRDLVLDRRIPNHAVGLVEYEVVVRVRDPDDLGAPVQFLFEALDGTSTGIPRAKNDDRGCHGSYSGVLRYKGFGTGTWV